MLTYGMTKYGLATSLQSTVEKAEQEIERFFDTFPEIAQLMKGFVHQAQQQGFVECIYHTKRRLPEIVEPRFKDGCERQAMNSPIQGSSAEITKRAMAFINSSKAFRDLGGRLLLTIHDEVITQIPDENLKLAIPLQQQLMIEACDRLVEMGNILIKVDAEVSDRWYGDGFAWNDKEDHKEDNDELDVDEHIEVEVEEEVEESVFG